MSQTSLAVCILFYEKLDQTIECVRSFLSAERPIYVLNNGSSPAASQKLTFWCRDFPQIKLLNVPENLGVSGGRNLLAQKAEEQWLLFVDNDIVVRTADWAEQFSRYLSNELDVLIPRLFNRHEDRYVEYRQLMVKGEKACFTDITGRETNVFPGGAALVNRNLFERLGYYDEEIFVGGEDFELSLRGVLSGHPVRALSVPEIELIHDHRQVISAEDVAAVQVRYDKNLIQNSYQRIEEMHGISLDDGWQDWADRQVTQQIPRATAKVLGLPRIALVADVRNWAFHNIAVSIQKYLGEDYDFDIYYLNEYFPDLGSAARDLFTSSYDLIHFLSRDGVHLLFNHILRRKDGVTADVVAGYIATPFTFSIYSHCRQSADDLNNLRIVFNYLAKGYTVSSVLLSREYRSFKDFATPTMIIEDGVDLDMFSPRLNSVPRETTERQLVVGWAGNSVWGTHVDGMDHKGLHSLIKPAIKDLQQEGLSVVGRFCDSSEGKTPYQEMVNYYQSLDIYVCASDQEGTPNPVLEAMACGLPIVSTRVGIVPELFGPLQQDFIVPDRSVGAIRDKIHLLIADPNLRRALSRENLDRISEWTREVESQKWQSFFALVLDDEKINSETVNSALPGSPVMKKLCLDFPFRFMFVEDVNDYLADSLSWKITAPLRKFHYFFNQWVHKYQNRKNTHKATGGFRE